MLLNKGFIGKLIGYLQRIFDEHFMFIMILFIINSLTTAWSLFDEDKIDVAIGYIFSVWLGSLIITCLIDLLPKRFLQKIVKAVLVIPIGLIFIGEFFTMYCYKALIGTGIINSALETNMREATEFFSMYIGFSGVVSVIVLIALIVGLYKYNPLKKITLKQKTKSGIVCTLMVLSVFYTIRMFTVYTDFIWDDEVLPVQRVYASTSVAVRNMQAYRELSSQVNSKVELTENKSEIKNIVFILGESTNRNHMHLYGYYLPNTPNLDALNEKGEISVFRDVVSPHSTTIAVLSKLFTFCNRESDQEWYHYNNLIDVMNAAGYKTYWLSNQETSGVWGNVAQIYAAHSDVSAFTRIRDSREDYGIVDGELFPLIDDAIANRSEDKNFYVVHLMGGHGLYYNRFPYSFSKFSKDDINLPITDGKKEIVAQYDNALYYNDYIVSSIIDKFRDSETLVIYVPDHGEAVYDEGEDMSGHIEENPTHHMIEIPVIMWASEKFRAKYPEKWEQIKKAADRPYMTDDMIHTVMDLADIKTAEFDPTRSIVNDKFNEQRPRIFDGMDYDAEIKNKR